jgi:hypothetical protein
MFGEEHSDVAGTAARAERWKTPQPAANLQCAHCSKPRQRRPKMNLETWELLSYVVTVIGLPFAIGIFVYEQRKERENEEEAVYQLLSDTYQDFLKVALDNPDLRLFSHAAAAELTQEQRERKLIVFNMLVSLFERAYLLLYDEHMSAKQARRWRSWEDYMREWCARPDFRLSLPELLRGEDPQFVAYILRLANAKAGEPDAAG